MTTIDLNSDMGESFGRWKLGDDEALLTVVSSANIACGFHAGGPSVMRRTLANAAANDVAVGAHVAYRDLAGFGRRYVDVAPAELTADVMYQLAALEGMAKAAGTRVHYVKPHGALYNRIVADETQAKAVVEAMRAIDPALALLTLPGSAVGRVAEAAGLRVFREAFADRAYTPDGTLVSRRLPGAVIADPDAVAARVSRMVTDGTVEAIDGTSCRSAPTRCACTVTRRPPSRSRRRCARGSPPTASRSVRSQRSQREDAHDSRHHRRQLARQYLHHFFHHFFRRRIIHPHRRYARGSILASAAVPAMRRISDDRRMRRSGRGAGMVRGD